MQTKYALGEATIADQGTGETLVAESSDAVVSSHLRSSAPAVGRAEGGAGMPSRGDHIGRFVVLGVLGTGGMGAVYSAYDPHLDRKVAIKLLHAEVLSGGGDAVVRLLREAQAMAKIDHRNVVKVHEVGTYERQVYVAMEFCPGGTLRAWLAQPGVPRDEIVDRFLQAGRGLAAAHAAGLVHRDFKPENVLLAADGTVRVTDFGLVMALGEHTVAPGPRPPSVGELAEGLTPLSKDLTRTGSIMGTPTYMAPEQFNGAPSTARTDQFAFCIALYEALYGSRPFAGSTYHALCVNVLQGKIQPAPTGSRVPNRLRRALLRGLAVDPDARYGSMTELLAALAPVRRRTWGAIALGGGLAAALGGGALWFMLSRAPAQATCAELATSKASDAWSPAAAQRLRAQFGNSGRSYADGLATTVIGELDHYTSRWETLAADTCTAERVTNGSQPELLVRRDVCLDNQLETLRDLAGVFVTADADIVDHATEVARGLPDLHDCSDEVALLAAPPAPPPAQAAMVADLNKQLDLIEARSRAGEYRQAHDDAVGLAARADKLGWTPVRARAHHVVGKTAVAMLSPARVELAKAGELATSVHLDRDAARCWSDAMFAAATERSPDAFAMLAEVARGTAERTNDRELIARVGLDHARGLLRLHHWQDGAAACKDAQQAVRQLDNNELRSEARDCLIEAYVPLGMSSLADPLLTEAIAETTKQLGADHPRVADFLAHLADSEARAGKLDDALRDAQRVLAISERAYPPKHIKVLEALHTLGSVYEARGDNKRAMELYDQALAASDASDPQQTILISFLHVGVGMYHAEQTGPGEHALALSHLEQAVDLTRAHTGAQSVELGILLLNYGQVKSEDNVDESLKILGEGRDILAFNHDKRADAASTAMMIVANNAKRYEDARKYAEFSLAHLDADSPPMQIALTKSTLAEVLAKTHGDRAHYRQLALEAKQVYDKIGPPGVNGSKRMTKFLATH